MNQIPVVRLAALVSGSGTTLQNFLDRIDDHTLPARVEVVISDREGCYALERARLRGIDAVVVPWKKYRDPRSFSDAMYKVIDRYHVDLITLAGFLRQIVVREDFRWRIMNIHPALIPAFCGKGFYGHRVHEAVIQSGVKVSGCTVHFVDDEYDHGPIIVQRTVPVLEDDTPDTLAARVFEQECIAYPHAIRLFGADCLSVEEGRVFTKPLPDEYAALGRGRFFLTIVMPVYNERATVRASIQRVLEVDMEKELIVVDDGSTDGTSEELDRLQREFGIRVIHLPKNRGKGAAVREGFKHASGDIVVVQDADLEYDPNELRELIEPIKRGAADVVYGSRLNGGKPQRVYLFSHFVANKFLSFTLDALYNTTLTDMETCYKVMTRRVLETLDLKSNGFEIEAEISAKVFKNQFRVYEMPISYYGRTYSEGKKIKWIDGIHAFWTLLKYRFFD